VPLRIAHSWNDHELPKECEQRISAPAHSMATRFLDEAQAEVRSRYPELDVGTILLGEAPSEGLIGLAEHAGLVVVGRRGLNSVMSMLLGSVSQRVVAHFPVPVVVVPEAAPAATAATPVVVGVAPGVPEPVEFAFAEAETRNAPLIAVRAWTLSNPYIVASSQAVTELDVDEGRELESVIEQARQAHPAVRVTTRVEFATAEAALVEAAPEAGLIVLGRHRRHGRYGLPLGRVPHRVLHLSSLPVAVVPN
jgi:nucleotide-binding universal stress UspA family protein